MPKCGSTYLQKKIFPQFGNCSYLFEGIVMRMIFNFAFELYKCENESGYIHDFDKKIMDIAEQIMLISGDNLIISSESYSGHPSGGFGMAKHIAKVINSLPFNIKIILIIRRQDNFLESLYKWHVNKGGVLDSDTFFNFRSNMEFIPKMVPLENSRVSENQTDWRSVDYGQYISYYADIFDSNNFCIFPFEEFVENKKKFLYKISNFIGWHSDLEVSEKFVNRGVSSLQFNFLLMTNRYRRKRNKLMLIEKFSIYFFYKVILAYNLIFFNKAKVIDTQKDVIVDFYRKCNINLSKKTGLILKKYGSY